MKILQLNTTSLQTSHNQLKFYQEQNDYDIITLEETNVKERYLRTGRGNSLTFTEKKLGFGVAKYHIKKYQNCLCQ